MIRQLTSSGNAKGGFDMKFKKMFSFVIMASLLCLSLIVSASAMGIDVMSYSDFFDCVEFREIQDTVLNSRILNDNGVLSDVQTISGDGGQLSCSYKVFSLKQMDLVAELQAGTELADLISDDYVWVVSTPSNATIRVAEVDGEWDVLGYSIPVSENTVTDLIQMDSLNTEIAILSTDQNTVASLLCFEAPMYHTNFVYMETENGEFLIPYGSRPDLTGLENGALYTPQEVSNILTHSFDGVYSENENAGAGSLGSDGNTGILFGSVVLIIVTGVVIAILIQKRKII